MQQTSIYILAATWAVSAAFILLGQTSPPGGAPEKSRIVINTLLWRILLLSLAGAVLLTVAKIDQDVAKKVASCAKQSFSASHEMLCSGLKGQATLTQHQRTELNQFAAMLLVLFGAAAVRSTYRALADGAGELPRTKAYDRKLFAGMAIGASCLGALFLSGTFISWLTDDLGDSADTLRSIVLGATGLLIMLTGLAAIASTLIDEDSETLDYGAQRRLGRALEQFSGRWTDLTIKPQKLGMVDKVDPITLAAFRSGRSWYLRQRDADALVHYHWFAARGVNEPNAALLQNQLELWPYWRYVELHVMPMEWFNRRQRFWAHAKRTFTFARRRRRDSGDELVNKTRLVRVDEHLLKSAGLVAVAAVRRR